MRAAAACFAARKPPLKPLTHVYPNPLCHPSNSAHQMTPKRKLLYCLVGNAATLLLSMCLVAAFRDTSSTYFRFGPQPDLLLVSVSLHTWQRWWAAMAIIGVLQVGEMIVNEIGSPILAFNVYNPDKKVITDFTKNELNFLANAMWFTNGVRSVFSVVVSVSQIDLALCSVVISEIASIFTVRLLLNEKVFQPKDYSAVAPSSSPTADQTASPPESLV